MKLTVEFIFIVLLILGLGLMAFSNWRERKRRFALEEQLEEWGKNREYEFLRRAKYSELGLLAAGITHEFNNSLGVILGSAEQLLNIYRKPGAEKALAQGLQAIVRHGEKMAKTVNGIREIIYKDDQEVEEDVPLADIIENVLIFCGQRIKNHGIELRLINVEGILVKGNRIELEQAILGLINNAFDAVDELPEKWIEINAVEGESLVDIYIRDSGHGIPQNVRSRMLDPFFSTKKGKGSGLGLPFIKGLAEKHGGDLIYVENSDHTTFMLELPRH